LQFAKTLRPNQEDSISLSSDFGRNRAKNPVAYYLPRLMARSFFLHGQKSQAILDFAPRETEMQDEKQRKKFIVGKFI
jgi:hypothetical protein